VHKVSLKNQTLLLARPPGWTSTNFVGLGSNLPQFVSVSEKVRGALIEEKQSVTNYQIIFGTLTNLRGNLLTTKAEVEHVHVQLYGVQ
jgi:hypothetical protein